MGLHAFYIIIPAFYLSKKAFCSLTIIPNTVERSQINVLMLCLMLKVLCTEGIWINWAQLV